MKGDDEREMYVKCGMFLGHDDSEETVLYWVKGMLFEEYTHLKINFNTKDAEIWQWGDGKYYKMVFTKL